MLVMSFTKRAIQLIVERKKYEVDDVKLESNILNLKEEIKSLENTDILHGT